MNVLNNYRYLQKYKVKSKNDSNFTFKNAYFLITNEVESEQQYSNHYDFYNINKSVFAKNRALNDNKFFFLNEMPHEISAMHFINFNEYYGMNLKNNDWVLLEAFRFDLFCNYFIYINKVFILEFILLHEYNLQCPSVYKLGPINSEYLFESVSIKDKFFFFFSKLYFFFFYFKYFLLFFFFFFVF